MEEATEKSRVLPYIDLLRLIAILAVITLHTVTGVSDVFTSEMSVTQIKIYTAIKYPAEIGVPLFLMISGALMLDPKKKISIGKLYGVYIKRLVLALLIFGTVFAFGELYIKNRDAGIPELIFRAFKRVLTGKSWAHLWYMYVIIGIYIFIPLFRAFAAGADRKIYGYTVLAGFILLSLLPDCLGLFDIRLKMILPFKGIYIVYFMAGYYFREYSPVSDNNYGQIRLLTAVVLIADVMAVFFEKKMTVDYSSSVTVLLTLCVFECVRLKYMSETGAAGRNGKTAFFKIAGFAGKIRNLIFGIYLIHTVFLNFSYKIIGVTPLACGGYILIPVFIIADFTASLIASKIMKMIPWFGNNVV